MWLRQVPFFQPDWWRKISVPLHLKISSGSRLSLQILSAGRPYLLQTSGFHHVAMGRKSCGLEQSPICFERVRSTQKYTTVQLLLISIGFDCFYDLLILSAAKRR